MVTGENKQTICRVYHALERGDGSVFGASLHPDCVWRLPGHSSWSRRFEGREAIERDLLGPLFGLFATPYRARAINLIAEQDFIFRFRDGKIVEIVEYGDTDLEERVLGRYQDVVQRADHELSKRS